MKLCLYLHLHLHYGLWTRVVRLVSIQAVDSSWLSTLAHMVYVHFLTEPFGRVSRYVLTWCPFLFEIGTHSNWEYRHALVFVLFHVHYENV